MLLPGSCSPTWLSLAPACTLSEISCGLGRGRGPKSSGQQGLPGNEPGLASTWPRSPRAPAVPPSFLSPVLSESPACHLAVTTSSRRTLQATSLAPLSHSPSPTLLSIPALSFPVLVCLVVTCPQPGCSEWAGPKSGFFTVLIQRPHTGLALSAPRLFGGPRDIPPRLGPWLCLGQAEPGTLGPAPCQGVPFTHQEKAHSRQYPPGHQLLSIVTAGRSGKAQESRGKSGVVKGKTGKIVRRNCG